MLRDYSITVRWTKDGDVQYGTYDIGGELPQLFEEVYEKSISDGKAIYAPEQIEISVVPKSH